MKLLITTLILFLFGIQIHGQEIPNGDLETWVWGAGGWYEQPEGWVTLNNQVMESAFKDTAPCEGELGLTVKPLAMTESLMGSAYIDFPISAIPPTLDFCVKTNIYEDEVWTDTCRVIISFWNGENQFYSEEWMSTSSISDWTNASIQLNQIEPLMDRCRIEVQASYPGIGLGSGSPQTWISVDNFMFDSANSIDKVNQSAEFKVYPNPSNNGSFKISSHDKLGEIIIYDLLGNIVEKTTEKSSEFTPELELSSGLYFIKVLGQTKRLVVR